MESIIMKFKVDRSENNETVKFLIPDLENSSVNITDSNTKDIENLFNLIFQEVIKSKKLIEYMTEWFFWMKKIFMKVVD